MNRLCHGLRALGLEPGDRLLLRLPNVPDFIVAWLACQKLGVVTVGTMPMLRARELTYIIEDSGARAAVVWGALREELERAREQAPELTQFIVAGEARSGDTTLESLLSGHAERFAAALRRHHHIPENIEHPDRGPQNSLVVIQTCFTLPCSYK